MDTFNKNNEKKDGGVVGDEEVEAVEESVKRGVVKSSQVTTDVGELTSDGILEEQLDTMSLGSTTSVSSSILNTPTRFTGQLGKVDEEVKPVLSAGIKRKGRQVRLSESQLRRFNYLLGLGYAPAAAHEAAQIPVHTGGTQKRQRSEDQPSPNTSGQTGPLKKRPKENQKHGPGVSFKEMAEAIPIAIICADYPENRLSREQLVAVKEELLKVIGDLVNPEVRPHFRSCEFKQGYLQLACGDVDTASWLKEAATDLVPWDGAALKAIETAELPKLYSFLGYFFDSMNDPSARILKMVENQNKELNTKAWRVVTRKVIAKTVELMLEVDEKSSVDIAANNFLLNHKFCKARFRKVTGNALTTKRGKSGARPSSKPAKGGTVLQKGKTESRQQPPVKTGTVPTKSKKTPMPQPPTSSTNADSGTVLLNSNSGVKPQPPAIGSSQNPPKGGGRKPETQSFPAPRNLNEDGESSYTGDKAGGSRQPQLTSTWVKDGTSGQ